ncbi:hypothetical protein A1O7_04622 [Cladophialophora yegresii CBS 114405]|uniref:Putative gamma-glutamylcyclotransferase n=1 Tax=Cladophialophora yegresii CBS 114405 TaxID=1182544 RepID=W9WQ14_9EURO|nr:uncharacterized protein A1O7_04622 [Cladophialophora yegresii CBS 114405]EXJ60469.1 hypothetical protein A1O7_04622 [Cladophialophora yegresii CBS 114405]
MTIGTLMAPGVLHRVIHGTHTPEKWQQDLITVRPAMLQHYRRHKVRHADYPAIIPHKGSRVRGSLVTGLNEQDLRRLDIFEGSMYKRDVVKVQVLKDVALDQAAPEDEEKEPDVADEVEAHTYVWLEDVEETLDPNEWDFAAFKRDKMRAWMGIEEDNSVEVDEGFADVDAAASAWDEADLREEGAERNGTTKKRHDPMGGRGTNGHITRQLEDETLR